MSDYDFYGGKPPHQDSTTSEGAADAIESSAATLRGEVFRFILGRGEYGATDQEVQQALDMKGNTQRPRRCELFDSGMIVDSGKTRKTKANRDAVVWIASDKVEPNDKQKPPPFTKKQKRLALDELRQMVIRAGYCPEPIKALGLWLARETR